MQYTILDFERDQHKQFQTKKEAVEYMQNTVYGGGPAVGLSHEGRDAFEHCLRYVAEEHLHDSTFRNEEWIEVNCHNGAQMIFPTKRVDPEYIYKMIEYWHEQIAYGSFGDESVAFEFETPELQRGYSNWLTDKWLKENLQTQEELEPWAWHDECGHFEELEEEFGPIESYDEMTPEQEARQDQIYSECEEYQIDDYIRERGRGYYNGPEIDRETIKNYIYQTGEYAQA